MKLSTETKVGLFFVIGVVILGLMLEIGNHWKFFDRGISYTTYLSSSTGLKPGDAVKLSGVEVGAITAISVVDSKVKVDFEVKKGTHIRQDSVAGIRMSSLLGGQFLGLTFGSPGSPDLPPGATVRNVESSGMDAVMEGVSGLTKDSRQLVLDLNRNQHEVLTKIAAMLEENRYVLHNSLTGLSSIATKLDRGNGSLSLLLNDTSLYKNVSELSGSLKEVSGRLERGEGTMGKLLTDKELYNDVVSAVKGVDSSMKDFTEIARRINTGEGTAGKLINDPVLYNEIRETATNLKEITRKINAGEGTMGKLINDDKLYRDAVSTLKKTEKAMEGLQDTGPISVLGSVIGTLF